MSGSASPASIAAAAAPAMNLCLFDLDHTLLPLDSDHAWGEFMIRLGWVDEASFRAGNDAFYADYQAGTLDIHAYVAFTTAPLRARTPAARARSRSPPPRARQSARTQRRSACLIQSHRR